MAQSDLTATAGRERVGSISDSGWERAGAATGIASVLLFIGGFLIVPTPPDVNAPAAEVAAYFTEEQDGIRATLVAFTAALFFYIWFLGSLRSALWEAEGGSGRVSAIAFGAGLVGAAALFLLIDLLAAAAFRPAETSPEVTTALNDAAVVSGAPALAALTALFAATAKVMLRSGVFPPWLGWLNAVAALAQPLAVGAMLTDSGAFAGDGALGLFVPVFSFGIALGATSVVLIGRAGERAGPAPAQ